MTILSKEKTTFFEIYKQLEVKNQEYINNKLANLLLQEIAVKSKLEPGEKFFSNISVITYTAKGKRKRMLVKSTQNILLHLKMVLVLVMEMVKK